MKLSEEVADLNNEIRSIYEVGDDHEESELCSICGGEKDWVTCYACGGDGGFDSDALMEEDPLWYDGIEWEDCRECEGCGGFFLCPNCEMG